MTDQQPTVRKATTNTYGFEMLGQTNVRRRVAAGDFIPPHYTDVPEGDYEVLDGTGPFHNTTATTVDVEEQNRRTERVRTDPEEHDPDGAGKHPDDPNHYDPVIEPSELTGDDLMLRARELDVPRRTVISEAELQQAVAEAEYAEEHPKENDSTVL